MTRTVIGDFDARDTAEQAVQDLRNKGFEKEISVLGSENQLKGSAHQDTAMDGITTGGTLGGLAGLALGAGALAIPGIGPIVAAGPLAGALSGVAAGGLAGGLIDYGIPANRSKFYEQRVREGKILVSLKADDAQVDKAAGVLRQFGAHDVETH
jgi:uncharacterized membrane protein